MWLFLRQQNLNLPTLFCKQLRSFRAQSTSTEPGRHGIKLNCDEPMRLVHSFCFRRRSKWCSTTVSSSNCPQSSPHSSSWSRRCGPSKRNLRQRRRWGQSYFLASDAICFYFLLIGTYVFFGIYLIFFGFFLVDFPPFLGGFTLKMATYDPITTYRRRRAPTGIRRAPTWRAAIRVDVR